MYKEAYAEKGVKEEVLPVEVREGYQQYAKYTWNSICAMAYPETGLPADQLHYPNGNPTETVCRIDKTSPTNIGFSLACVGAASSLGFINSFEANQKLNQTITTIENMIDDPEVFVKTGGKKGLFINWIQPSTGKVLNQWPDNLLSVKQQISTVDNAWLIAFSKLISVQFPEFNHRIQNYLDQIDLPFMFDNEAGFFHGCYDVNASSFENWYYDVISEARIAYLVCDDNIAEHMSNLINKKSERSVFTDSLGRHGRASWGGGFFEWGWPHILIPESDLNSKWKETLLAAIQEQKDFGLQHNGGHYGYSAGLGPDGNYHEFRVPKTGESEDPYVPQKVVTISALVNMGIVDPVGTWLAMQRLHEEFKGIVHIDMGDGDTINTDTGECQCGQLLPNQATSLLACWNILDKCRPQELFMQTTPLAVRKVYELCPLW